MGIKFNPFTGQFDLTGSSSGGGSTIGTPVTGSTPYSILSVDGAGNLSQLGPLTNGQLLIGSTGTDAQAATLTGTVNQISVSLGAGTITLSTPQDIAISSSPTFAGLTVTGLLGVVKASAGVLSASSVDLTSEVAGVLPIANGGTNSSVSLNNNRFIISSGGAIVEHAAVAANRALASDASGLPVASTTTDTELGYVSGVTSGIQAQLDSKAFDADVIKKDGSIAFTGNQSLAGNKFTSVGAPSANGEVLIYDQLGANNGIATLDGGGKVPVSQLPSAVMTYEGVWNAATNSPTLADGSGDAGMVYRVGTSGTQDLGSGPITFDVGDYVIYNGTTWEKSDTTDAVASVNGQTGIVTVDAINQLTGDVTAGPASGSQSQVATIASRAVTGAKIALDTILDENVNSAAAIARSKLASGNAYRIIRNDSTGAFSEAGALTNGQLLIGSTGAAPVEATLTGTANQIIVTTGVGSITLSTPQSIGTGSSPTFSSLTLSSTLNQLVLGTTNTTTVSATAPASSVTVTIPDPGTNASFVLTEGTQTINGNKTLSGTINLTSLSASRPLKLDVSKNIISTQIDLASSNDITGILPIANGGTATSSTPANGQILIGNGTSYAVANIIGTANQVIVTNGSGSITLSLPQSIATSSTPTFASETLSAASNQLTLSTATNAVTVNSGTSAAARTYSIPDVGTTADFVMTAGSQTIGGVKTFTGAINANTSVIFEDPGAGTNTTTVRAGTVSSSYTLTLPTAVATANSSALVSDTSGNLSYVTVSAASTGDIAETSFTHGVDTVTNQTVTGFAFSTSTVGSFDALVYVKVVATSNQYAVYKLNGVYNGSTWYLSQDFTGNSTTITFSITAAGQIQYTKTGASSGFVSTNMKFRAITTGN